MSLYLGLDVGTQSCKAVVWNIKKKAVVSRGRGKYDIIQSDTPGCKEQHPRQWTKVRGLAFAQLSTAMM